MTLADEYPTMCVGCGIRFWNIYNHWPGCHRLHPLVCDCPQPDPQPVPLFGGHECGRCHRLVLP